MVEDVDVEQTPGGQRFGRQVYVIGRWSRIARRMVMDQDHRGDVVPDRLAKELADSNE